MQRKVIILLGLGHCHIQVVRNWKKELDRHWRKIVICPENRIVYSGMLTGCVAGLYSVEEASIDVKSVCKYFQWTWIKASVVDVNPDKRCIRCLSPKGSLFELRFDVLSINVGSETCDLKGVTIEEAVLKKRTLLSVRPVGTLVSRLAELETRVGEHPASRGSVVVIGGGYAGVELAFCLNSRFKKKGTPVSIRILESQSDGLKTKFGILPGMQIATELQSRGIVYEDGVTVVAVRDGEIQLSSGECLPFAFALLCTGAQAPKWLRETKYLRTDSSGFLSVRNTLQTPNNENIFACGDCCSLESSVFCSIPKAGVFAVRQGPVLSYNLNTFCEAYQNGRKDIYLRSYYPQKHYLSLLSTGDGRAIGMKFGLVCVGRCVWKLKDRIDRNWVRQNSATDCTADEVNN
eukprot:jgi/Galph1/3150/GphlegSOOS_G1768.1